MNPWRRVFLPLLLPIWAGVSHAAPPAAEPIKPPAKAEPAGLSVQQFYQYLLAEIAGVRGQLPIASAAMSDMARQTQDAGVARRAAELALAARQYGDALVATRIWIEHEPESPAANQMMVALLAGTGHLDELREHLRKLMKQDPAQAAEMLLRLNRLFARVADKNEALRQIEAITAEQLQLPEAHMARAQAAYAADQRELAMQSLDRALSLRPNWEAAVLFKSLLLQQQTAAVVTLLEPFVRNNPQSLDARITLARALVAEKRYADARAQFERASASAPDNIDVKYALALLALQLKDNIKAEALLRELVAMEHPESSVLRTYLGQLAEDRQANAEAIEWYSKVGPGPQQVPAFARAAQLLFKAGRVDEARTMLQALPANSDAERAQRVITEAQLLRESNRFDDAWKVLDRAATEQPGQPELVYEAALAADRIGQYERMESLLRQLIRQKPDYAHAYNALGYSFAERSIRLDEAVVLIDKALSLAPDDPFILDSKGWVLYRKGDKEGALAALQKAFALRPDPEIAAHMGEVLWMLGRKDEARKLWQDMLKANPGHEVLLETIKKFAP